MARPRDPASWPKAGEEQRDLAEEMRVSAELSRQNQERPDEARRAATELHIASEIAIKAAYDQSAITHELRQTLQRLEASSERHEP